MGYITATSIKEVKSKRNDLIERTPIKNIV